MSSLSASRSDDSARGRAVGFTMAMLQRRFASSIYAVRRSLARMKEKREHILENPEKHRQDQISKRLPDDFDELPEEEQQEIIAEAEDQVVSYNPSDLREEVAELGALIRQAKILEDKEQEVRRLKALLTERGGEDDRRFNEDFRPELHDSDGLSQIDGYRCLNLIRASAVVNCQSAHHPLCRGP